MSLPPPPPEELPNYRAFITASGIAIGIAASIIGGGLLGISPLPPALVVLAVMGTYHAVAGRRFERELREGGEGWQGYGWKHDGR